MAEGMGIERCGIPIYYSEGIILCLASIVYTFSG